MTNDGKAEARGD